MGVDFDLERPLLSSHLQDSLNRRSEEMARVYREEISANGDGCSQEFRASLLPVAITHQPGGLAML